MPERRAYPRLTVAYEYNLSGGGRFISGETRDVSPFGAGLLCSESLQPGEEFTIQFYVPKLIASLEARGRVIYSVENPDPTSRFKYLVGVQFREGILEDFSLPDSHEVKAHYAPSHTILINAEAKRCYQLLSEFERYPEWTSGVEAVRVLERYPDGRGKRVEFIHDFFFRKIRYVLDYSYDDEKNLMSWVSPEADKEIVSITGSYHFSAREKDTTFATYQLDIKLSIIPSKRLVDYVTKILMRSEMRNFKKFVEGAKE